MSAGHGSSGSNGIAELSFSYEGVLIVGEADGSFIRRPMPTTDELTRVGNPW